MSKKRQVNPLYGKKETQQIQPDYALKHKIGRDIKMKDVFTKERVEKSQEVINVAQASFFDEAEIDLQVMERAYADLRKHIGGAKDNVFTIERNAHLMKGQAESLGYELIAHVAKSLHNYAENNYSPDDSSMIVFRKHLDTLKVAFHQRLEGNGGQIGAELIKSLELLIEKFKKVE